MAYISQIKYKDNFYDIKATQLASTGVSAGYYVISDGNGGTTFTATGGAGGGISRINNYTGAVTLGTGLNITSGGTMSCNAVSYTNSVSGNNSQGVGFVITNQVPQNIYAGWLYIILES